MKKVLITGILGQDGSYLAELLFDKAYEIHGVEREPISDHAQKIKTHLAKKRLIPIIHSCNLNDFEDVQKLITEVKPDECFHLAVTHYSSEMIGVEQFKLDRGLLHNNLTSLLNIAYALLQNSPDTKLVVAGSCLMYDDCLEFPQKESLPFQSKSIYGLSKIMASEVVSFLRKNFGLRASTAILYNHESPRRTSQFVTKKIVENLVKIKRKEITTFKLGDISVEKDWGYAKDYVRGLWLISQQPKPGDYILATGELHTVEEFVSLAARLLGINWIDHVEVDNKIIRERLKSTLVGDSSLARNKLQWQPSVDFKDLVKIMVDNEFSGSLD